LDEYDMRIWEEAAGAGAGAGAAAAAAPPPRPPPTTTTKKKKKKLGPLLPSPKPDEEVDRWGTCPIKDCATVLTGKTETLTHISQVRLKMERHLESKVHGNLSAERITQLWMRKEVHFRPDRPSVFRTDR
jgi:hypothetical protein